jgi:hypothetical protein
VIQLTGMMSQVDQHFGIACNNHTLFLTIGGKSTASHNASVALDNDVDCEALPGKMMFNMAHFTAVVKNAGNLPCTIRFAKEGIGGILVETEHGTYSYILRGIEG